MATDIMGMHILRVLTSNMAWPWAGHILWSGCRFRQLLPRQRPPGFYRGAANCSSQPDHSARYYQLWHVHPAGGKWKWFWSDPCLEHTHLVRHIDPPPPPPPPPPPGRVSLPVVLPAQACSKGADSILEHRALGTFNHDPILTAAPLPEACAGKPCQVNAPLLGVLLHLAISQIQHAWPLQH